MKENVFNKEKFIEDVKENVKNLYRKTLEEASQQEILMTGLQQRKRLTNRIQRWSIICPWNF